VVRGTVRSVLLAGLLSLPLGFPAAAQGCFYGICTDRPADPATLGYRIFREPGLGLKLKYPSRVFIQVPTVEPTDPLFRFVSRDGRAGFSLTALPNPDGVAAAALMDAAIQTFRDAGASILYQRRRDNWYVLTGFLDGRIYYHKTIMTRRGRTIGTLQIMYPPEQKPFYYQIVEQMAWSFVPVR
jgi:hypothetical protein